MKPTMSEVRKEQAKAWAKLPRATVDHEVEEALIRENVGLIGRVLRPFHLLGQHVIAPDEWEDMRACATMGLLHAIRLYSPEHAKGASFGTYAFIVMRGYVYQYLARRDLKAMGYARANGGRWPIIIPVDFSSLDNRAGSLSDLTESGPNRAANLAMKRVNEESLARAHEDRRRIEGASFAKLAIHDALAELPDDRLRDIIRHRFWDNWTLEKTGLRFRVSRERIRQLESKALDLLRKSLERRGVRSRLGTSRPEPRKTREGVESTQPRAETVSVTAPAVSARRLKRKRRLAALARALSPVVRTCVLCGRQFTQPRRPGRYFQRCPNGCPPPRDRICHVERRDSFESGATPGVGTTRLGVPSRSF